MARTILHCASLLVMTIVLSSCMDFRYTTKIKLEKHSITRADTIYFLPTYVEIQKKSPYQRDHYQWPWRFPIVVPVQMVIDTVDGQRQTLIRDIDSTARVFLGPKNPVAFVSVPEGQQRNVLANYQTMISHFTNHTDSCYTFDPAVKLENNKFYAMMYMEWKYFPKGTKYEYYSFKTTRTIPGDIYTDVNFHFCLIRGGSNEVIYYRYSTWQRGESISPNSPNYSYYKMHQIRKGLFLFNAYKDDLRRLLDKVTKHYHPPAIQKM